MELLRGSRQESDPSRAPWLGAAGGKNKPPNFVPSLIISEINKKDDLTHQALVAAEDPIANYIISGLATNTFDDWFRLTDENGEETERHKRVQAELKRLNAPFHFVRALTIERTHGWAWMRVARAKRDDLSTTQRVASLDVFSPLECKVVEYDSVTGAPKTLEVSVVVGVGAGGTTKTKRLEFPADEFVLWRTDPFDRSFMGRPAVYAVWDYLVYLRYIIHAINFYLMKIGLGAFTVMTKKNYSDEIKAAITAAVEDLSVKRALLLSSTEIDSVDFKNASGSPVDFAAIIDALLGLISAGCRVPKDILRGASAGAITGSETNIKTLNQVINSIQSKVEIPINEVIDDIDAGLESWFDWNVRFTPDPVMQAQVEESHARSLAIASKWMTVNEVRDAYGLPAIESGDVLSQDFNINVAGLQSMEEAAQTRNPSGVNV